MEDNKLWEALSRDDYDAFNLIVDRYYSALLYFSNTITQDYEASQDVVQELFVRLWTRRKKQRSYLSLKSFLYTSVRNRSLNYLRSQKKIDHYPQKSDFSEESFVKGLLSEEVYQMLRSAIETLPERNQVVVEHTILGTRQVDIADILGVSLRTVNNIKSDSFELLRSYFEKVYQ